MAKLLEVEATNTLEHCDIDMIDDIPTTPLHKEKVLAPDTQGKISSIFVSILRC